MENHEGEKMDREALRSRLRATLGEKRQARTAIRAPPSVAKKTQPTAKEGQRPAPVGDPSAEVRPDENLAEDGDGPLEGEKESVKIKDPKTLSEEARVQLFCYNFRKSGLKEALEAEGIPFHEYPPQFLQEIHRLKKNLKGASVQKLIEIRKEFLRREAIRIEQIEIFKKSMSLGQLTPAMTPDG